MNTFVSICFKLGVTLIFTALVCVIFGAGFHIEVLTVFGFLQFAAGGLLTLLGAVIAIWTDK